MLNERKDNEPVFEGVGSVDETADNSASSTGNIPAGKYTYSEQTDETGRLTCDFVRQRNKEKARTRSMPIVRTSASLRPTDIP